MSLIEHNKKIVDALAKFRGYIGRNRSRRAVSIRIDYKHKRFHDKGFATLELTGTEMNEIVMMIEKAVSAKITEANIEINEIIKHERERGNVDRGVDS